MGSIVLNRNAVDDGTARGDRESNLLISSLRNAWRDDFNGDALNPADWSVVSQGVGQTITLAGGEITIGAGTTAGEETLIRSVGTVSIPCRAWFICRLSQRIANQEFRMELVNAAGDMVAGWLLDGTTATNAKHYSANGGNLGVSAVQSVSSTASDQCFELEMFPDEFWAIQRNVDSSAARTNSYCRTRNIPDPNDTYHLQIRVTNLGAAPSSNTNLILGAVAVQDINEITAEITGGRGDNSGAKAIAVALSGSSMQIVPAASTGPSSHHKLPGGGSAASTNATSVKTTACVVTSLTVANLAAATRYYKVYNKSSAPTVGTDTPTLVYAIPAGQMLNIQNSAGLRFSSGFAYAITGGIADADTTAIGANEVTVAMTYT